MKIEERLNRLEVNQMHMIDLLQTLMERLPEKKLDKIEDPKGDRVLLTLNGKFLPYKSW